MVAVNTSASITQSVITATVCQDTCLALIISLVKVSLCLVCTDFNEISCVICHLFQYLANTPTSREQRMLEILLTIPIPIPQNLYGALYKQNSAKGA